MAWYNYALGGAAALGGGYVVSSGWNKIAGGVDDSRGNSGHFHGMDSGTLSGPGNSWTQNPFNSFQHPMVGIKSQAKDFQYKMTGGRLYGTQGFDPSVMGLAIDKTNIGATVRTGGFDPEFEDPANMPGQVIGGTLTNDERAMIQLMDPKDRARYLLQKRIQEKAEMAVLLSQLQSLRHQTAMSVINNIR